MGRRSTRMAIKNFSLLFLVFLLLSLLPLPAVRAQPFPGDEGDGISIPNGADVDRAASDLNAGDLNIGDSAGDLNAGDSTSDINSGESAGDINAGDVASDDMPSGGEWLMLQQSIGISAMHMQLLPGDMLVIFDRTDFGPSNISLPDGRCRRDPSDTALKNDCTAHSVLFNISSASFRPLNILTDTWCSSGSLLPNGSLLQTGGFNDGDRVARIFDPFSTAGDWIELPGYLSARRWYASNQLLPDGSVIIIGGRRQFNYEFFPRRDHSGEDPLVRFDFLLETRDGNVENNLYPFLHLLPDGNLFIFANTGAVILDASANAIVRTLPRMPDGVPRSYPSSGSSVLLALRLPNPSPEILICGGAPRGSFEAALNGTFFPAARTCGRISPTAAEPVWAMEEMPMERVMGDMVLLPTGDVLIVNGAAMGTAGWELARRPVTSPLLYRSDSPEGGRFTVLTGSPTPRLYHATAVLDSYGRVIVGGSNPHISYKFFNVTYPTELSVEAFLPPYMDSSLAALRPRIAGDGSAAAAEMRYGEKLGVRFTVGMYRGSEAVEVVLVAPAFVTHTVGMNQRAVVLPATGVTEVDPSMHEMEVVGPPAPEVAPPGYYLMFVVHAGVPSEGVWVRVNAG
ncbi:hypothetical protein AXF42_Ash002127 [Apostasia shenzhenica]|uniref:Galactose oxidase n=1 Tax=Apostasia shenzhenica TaxID=1088818 RepID=A0A2I0AMR4_9ASPA|nr:hypothetical protein AXF42_Ash002127 [Apostasia shenzhenica]